MNIYIYICPIVEEPLPWWAHNGMAPVHIPRGYTEARSVVQFQIQTHEVRGWAESMSMRQSPRRLREDTWSVARSWCLWARCRCRACRHAGLGSVQCRAGTPAPLLQRQDRETLVRCCSDQNRHSSTARHLPELSLHWLSALRDSVVAASLARNPFVKTLLCSHCMLSCSNCRVICKSKTQHFYRVFLSMKNHNAQRATVQLTSMMASFSSSSASGEMEKTHSEFEPVIGGGVIKKPDESSVTCGVHRRHLELAGVQVFRTDGDFDFVCRGVFGGACDAFGGKERCDEHRTLVSIV